MNRLTFALTHPTQRRSRPQDHEVWSSREDYCERCRQLVSQLSDNFTRVTFGIVILPLQIRFSYCHLFVNHPFGRTAYDTTLKNSRSKKVTDKRSQIAFVSISQKDLCAILLALHHEHNHQNASRCLIVHSTPVSKVMQSLF